MVEKIGAYLDRELSGAEVEAFREHLAGCEDCRRELADQESLWALLGELKTGQSTPELTRRILGATVKRPMRVGRVLRWAVPLAAAASLLVAVLVMQPGRTVNTLDPETTAVIQKLDVLEHLEVLENLDLLQQAVKEPIFIEDPDAVGTVIEEGPS